MVIIIIASVLLIALVFRFANQCLPFAICSICAGVSGTWLWMLAGMFSGLLSYQAYSIPTAVLMGGSVVGIAYTLEKRLKRGQNSLLWKTLFITVGIALVYEIITLNILNATLFLFVTLAVVYGFFGASIDRGIANKQKSSSKKIKDLEKKLKDCC